ncbi:DNA-directed RNA polymerase III subunit RPC4 [Gryllus bimaculatus]|nr:DNA-directed RNA polymerase III subunit RPC4 [Gryllus bimaculatus]
MSEDNIKNEPKVLPQRLMSFRGSRDLSLGSGKNCVGLPNRDKSRKNFTPNLNVQRKKNQEVNVKSEFSKAHQNKGPRGGRGRGQGRGRHSATLVQASGSVFAEGIAVSGSVSRRAKYDTDKVKDEVLQIPKLNLKLNCKVDKEEEERKLKELLRDDFVDDSDLAPDTAFAPISIPLNNYIKAEQESNFKLEFKPKVKEEKEMIIDGVKIKQEIVEKDEDEVETSLKIDPTCIKKEPQNSQKYENMFLNITSTSTEKRLILIQFPDRLPALSVDSSEDIERPNSSNVKPKPGQPVANSEGVSEKNKYCRLSDLAPGHIGHLQIRRSGKIELVMGKCVLNVSSGTNVSFQQDLIAVQLHSGNQCTGETVDLGPVVPRLICTPDWNTLLKSGGNL